MLFSNLTEAGVLPHFARVNAGNLLRPLRALLLQDLVHQ